MKAMTGCIKFFKEVSINEKVKYSDILKLDKERPKEIKTAGRENFVRISKTTLSISGGSVDE